MNIDKAVDISDLEIFLKDWLWVASWTKASRTCAVKGVGTIGDKYLVSTPPQEKPEVLPPDPKKLVKWLMDIWDQDENLRRNIERCKWNKLIEEVSAMCPDTLSSTCATTYE